ncbi:hypothetical protein M2475_000412 [Breznakia sp. PF5-3]|uniref:hypothetical protein n=1 Tax=unclassified Breznakia TaxID=2623764 RepID=UPI0024077654|nr:MULTISPECIES: hypothetical protein [unclassified Breznakia]MDF9824074.1 hypothetical protein [Breznakia sp. PM6-1]MDF9834860.1 hypothetical protein [Breznakia sp. PF5-3]MDF9837118.1 hypothetical protein [Breznakia sp. PFB2-8]MDF9859043.1 hypothetical protein [Breznakia sp. PH5-24]
MSIKKQVKRFWKVFLEEKNNLEKALAENNSGEINEIVKILNTYFEEFTNSSLEVGISDDFYELTFHSGQDKNVQLICAVLKSFAPKALSDKWIINAYLPPLSEKALHTVLRIKEQEYHPEDFIVYYTIDDVNKSFHVEIYCDAFSVLDPNKANEIAVYMLQLFIGECALEAYIGNIEVIDAQKGGNYAILPEFYEVMLEIIDEKEWPEYNDPTTIYRVYQLQDEKIVDEVRKDMKMIFTVHPILISEVLNNEFVTYHEFYDYGGEFGYLYYKNNHGSDADALYRQQLEKKLNELLFPHGIAKSIGGAIGTNYSYIDLAIYDKEEFLKALDKINNHLSVELTYKAFE